MTVTREAGPGEECPHLRHSRTAIDPLDRAPTNAINELHDRDATLVTVLADEHAVVRGALRRVLEAEGGFEVVAEAADVGATLRKVLAYKPSVLVLDLNMPGGSSLEAIPRLLEASPRTRIVVLTMDDAPQSARAALRSGALAFVLKEAADTELIDAAGAAARRQMYLDPELGTRVAAEAEGPAGGADGLTDREIQVLRLAALGFTNTEIAHQLYLSPRTIEARRTHIQQKINHRSRAEMSAYARASGLVDY